MTAAQLTAENEALHALLAYASETLDEIASWSIDRAYAGKAQRALDLIRAGETQR